MQINLVPTRTFTCGVETLALSLRRADPGCWTGNKVGVGDFIGSKGGLSALTLTTFLHRVATAEDMAAVTQDTVNAVFGSDYWLRMNGPALPAGLDLQVVDHGYNRGQATSAMLLQRLLGVKEDGWVGDATVAAIASWSSARFDAALVDARALQTVLGVTVDGEIGDVTRAALTALPAATALRAVLYAAQVLDYAHTPGEAENPGWNVRAKSRWAAARTLAAKAQPDPAP